MKTVMDKYLGERFQRQLQLTGFDSSSQECLRESRVLVIGAGGLGCPVLMYLAAAGVGRLDVADGDVVEISNLHRQVLFGVNDAGRNKAIVAIGILSARFPELAGKAIPEMVTQTNALALLEGYDLIIDGSDNFQTRYIVNDACALLNKPLLYGAVNGFEGQVALFNPGMGADRLCYRDLFPSPPPPGVIPDCMTNGILGTVPGLAGVLMAGEAIKFLAGMAVQIGRLRIFNALSMEFHELEITPSDDKKQPDNTIAFLAYDYHTFCGGITEVQEASFEDLNSWWHDNPAEVCVIDVRERQEISGKLMPGIINLPASEWDLSLDGIDKRNRVVLLCQTGVRSRRVGGQLKKRYPDLKVYSLKGGVHGLRITIG